MYYLAKYFNYSESDGAKQNGTSSLGGIIHYLSGAGGNCSYFGIMVKITKEDIVIKQLK